MFILNKVSWSLATCTCKCAEELQKKKMIFCLFQSLLTCVMQKLFLLPGQTSCESTSPKSGLKLLSSEQYTPPSHTLSEVCSIDTKSGWCLNFFSLDSQVTWYLTAGTSPSAQVHSLTKFVTEVKSLVPWYHIFLLKNEVILHTKTVITSINNIIPFKVCGW